LAFTSDIYFLPFPKQRTISSTHGTNLVAYIHLCGDVGFFLTCHSELMLTPSLRDLYHRMLTSPADSVTAVRLLCQVLTNIHSYLVEEELKMMKAEAECKYSTLSLLVSSTIFYC